MVLIAGAHVEDDRSCVHIAAVTVVLGPSGGSAGSQLGHGLSWSASLPRYGACNAVPTGKEAHLAAHCQGDQQADTGMFWLSPVTAALTACHARC